MKSEIIKSLADNFENHSQTTDSGIEFWFARDIQHLLGYKEWRNFNGVIKRANNIILHKHLNGKIEEIKRTVDIGSGAKREILDFRVDKEAYSVIKELTSSFKLNNSFSIRNETIVLQLTQKYCSIKSIHFEYQYKLDTYYFDFMIGNKVLLEFDEPHHKVNSRQIKIDREKDTVARANKFILFRVNLDMDIIDIILFLEKYV